MFTTMDTKDAEIFLYNADQLLLVLDVVYITIYKQTSGNTHILKICYIEPLALYNELIFTHL